METVDQALLINFVFFGLVAIVIVAIFFGSDLIKSLKNRKYKSLVGKTVEVNDIEYLIKEEYGNKFECWCSDDQSWEFFFKDEIYRKYVAQNPILFKKKTVMGKPPRVVRLIFWGLVSVLLFRIVFNIEGIILFIIKLIHGQV